MLTVTNTDVFAKWIDGLKDVRARARVQVRIARLAGGNPGDVKPVGEGVSEMRIDYVPGYRVYFTRRGTEVVVLLVGGQKKRQSADIQRAIEMSRAL
jgi:putative addiction module killer protein